MFRSAVVLELGTALLLFFATTKSVAGQAESNTAAESIGSLNDAVRNNRLDLVRRLVTLGVDVNSPDAAGNSPLMTAVLSGNTITIGYLLAHGANANLRASAGGPTALRYAVMTSRADVVKMLLAAGADVRLRYAEQQTVLHLAASSGSVECAQLLMAAHADPNALDTNRHTPLDDAILHGRTTMVPILLAGGADPRRVRPADGRGALHEACVKGYAALVPLLVEAGADPVLRDDSGQTPLDLALDYKNRAAVAALLRLAPANKKLQAVFSEAMEAAVRRGRTEIVRLLIDSGLDVNQPTEAGSTYLNDAALGGQGVVVRLLLDRGARLDVHNQNGGTPLHDAAISGNTEVIALLLDRGCAVDAKDLDSGATPLMLAASLGRNAAVALLLSRGANPALKDNSGRTALARAKEGQDPELLKLLERAEGKPQARAHTG